MNTFQSTSRGSNFLKKINLSQKAEFLALKTKEGIAGFLNSNKNLLEKLSGSPSAEEFAEELFESLNHVKKALKKKIFPGDLVSSKSDDTFIKGKVKEEKENSYILDHYTKGEVEVPKDKTVKFFFGQKYDLRELNNLYSKEYNMQFKNIPKKDLINLLSGKETAPLKISTMVNDEIVKQDLIRLKINKFNNQPSLNVIRAYDNRIYNKELPENTLTEIKAGKEQEMSFKTKAGKEYKAVVYWDEELKGLRTKRPDEQKKETKKTDLKKENKKTNKKKMKL